MTTEEDAFARGELSGRVRALESRADRNETATTDQIRDLRVSMDDKMREMSCTLAEVADKINQNYGGGRVLLALLTLAGSLFSGLLVRFIH